jgi:hypothetical protein
MEHNLVAAVDVLQILYITYITIAAVVIQTMFIIQEMTTAVTGVVQVKDGLYTTGIVAIVEEVGHQKHIQKVMVHLIIVTGMLETETAIIVYLLVHSLQHLIIHIVELVECQMDKYFIHMAGNN